MYLLDTNTLIYFFKGMGNVSSRLLETPPINIAIPTIVLFEIEAGIAKSISPEKRLLQLKNITDAVNIVSFGIKEARVAAILRAKLEKRGTPIGPYDVIIAGTALAQGAILVTHNYKEFRRVEGLQLEDWY